MLTKTRLRKKIQPLLEVTQAIAHPIRVSILHMIARHELEPWQIAEGVDISKPLVFHHLNMLKKAGWIHKEKYGKKAYYRLERGMLVEFQKLLRHITDPE